MCMQVPLYLVPMRYVCDGVNTALVTGQQVQVERWYVVGGIIFREQSLVHVLYDAL